MTGIAEYSAFDAERFVAESAKTSDRSAFARDRARVLHSVGLRRLAAKTQVVVSGVHDFPRTRLTHTLEVAQIGREIGVALGCDPDLVEVAGLTHDIGHPPFGHNGESELDRIARDIGGFEGNAQTLRVLTRLEAKVAGPDGRSVGLNLSRAALDAACKYPWSRREGSVKFGVYDDDLPIFAWFRAGAPQDRTCLEEQIMDWSDDVAYSVHDVEDAVHSGHVQLGELRDAGVQRVIVDVARERFCPDRDPDVLIEACERLTHLPGWPRDFDGSMSALAELKALTSLLIGRFCLGTQSATTRVHGPGPHHRYDAQLVVPAELRDEVAVMKAIAVHYVMNRDGAEAEYARQSEVISGVVHALRRDEGRSLEPWLRSAYDAASSDAERLRVIVDQVASLTDNSILQWHERLVRR